MEYSKEMISEDEFMSRYGTDSTAMTATESIDSVNGEVNADMGDHIDSVKYGRSKKEYITFIYDALMEAYGSQGTVSKGAFDGDFDDFYDRITIDQKYADKIYGALMVAYGPAGVYERGYFTHDKWTYRKRLFGSSQL